MVNGVATQPLSVEKPKLSNEVKITKKSGQLRSVMDKWLAESSIHINVLYAMHH